jgi:hypothetical protein
MEKLRLGLPGIAEEARHFLSSQYGLAKSLDRKVQDLLDENRKLKEQNEFLLDLVNRNRIEE